MSYFFQDGKIYVILNKLEKLSTDDYDSIGTAKMVIRTLCDTLGIGESKLAQILKHFVYDGVYSGEYKFTLILYQSALHCVLYSECPKCDIIN